MINPQHLRIGNIVYGPTGFETVCEILQDCIHTDEGVRLYDDIDGIEITPEILEKIEGYDRQMEGMRMFSFYPDKITLCWGEYCVNSSEVPVKYLHELQNLFYCLYKKELTINL